MAAINYTKEQMEKYLASLQPKTREYLNKSDEERIYKTQEQVWIPYPRAEEVLLSLEKLIRYPKKDRMPNLLIVGDTNSGKTSILNRFKERYKPYTEPFRHSIPLIHFSAPIAPSHNALYEKILDFLRLPYGLSDPASRKEYQVLETLRDVQTRMIIIDEFQDIFHGEIRQQKKFLAGVKHLGNELQIPIVAAGVHEVHRVISFDPQMANRFETIKLEKWKLDINFARLVASFETTLPLKEPSYLASKEMLEKLYIMSEGVLGELATILQKAAEFAIINKKEHIDVDVLRSIRYIKPSDRGR